METLQSSLELSEIFRIMGIMIMGYLVMMGTVVVLFRMLFPITTIETKPVMSRVRKIKNSLHSSRAARVRKMKLAHE